MPGLYRKADPAELDRYFAGVHTFYATLPADRYPALTAIADDMTGPDSDERFAFGCELEATCRAVEQPRAEPRLEARDELAHARSARAGTVSNVLRMGTGCSVSLSGSIMTGRSSLGILRRGYCRRR